MQMNTENLAWREGRREIDLVVDEVEDELHKERVGGWVEFGGSG